MAAPTLTPDTSGNPRVEVFLGAGDVEVGTARVRLWRYSDGREWLVRGGVDIAPGVPAIDWEAPFQTAAQYRAEMFDAAGVSIGFTDVAQTTLDVSSVWVHNPLVPARAVNLGPIGILDGDPQTIRPLVGGVVYGELDTVGRRIGAGRRGVTNKPIGFAVESTSDADALQEMLGAYDIQQVGVLCIRTPPPVRWPRTFFASVESPREVDVDVRWGGSRTDLVFEATEVTPPFPGITTPLLTYSDMSVAFDTYTALSAAIATYTESSRSYEYAGLAG